MGGQARRLKLRLFIEGVEVPCISAQVQSSPNSPMVASIQIPPLGEATEFLPKSLVHVFFYDDSSGYDFRNIRKTGDSKDDGKTEETMVGQSFQNNAALGSEGQTAIQEDLQMTNYKLLFVGELMGFQYTKAAINRSIVLQCQDLSNYWDFATQYNNSDLFGPGMKAMFSGGSTNLFTDFLSAPGGQIVAILMQPSTRYPKLGGLLGGIIHVLEAMGGSYYYEKKYAGQNVFFSMAELRLRITQMLTAYDKDPTAKKLLGGGYDSLFGRSIGNIGEQASFRKIINMLSSVIFHETYGQPCPKYVAGTGGTQTGFERKKLKDVPYIGYFAGVAEDLAFDISVMLGDMDAYSKTSVAPDPKKVVKDKNEHMAGLIRRVGTIQKGCMTSSREAKFIKPKLKASGLDGIGNICDQLESLFKQAGTSAANALSKLKNKAAAAKGAVRQDAINLLTKTKEALLKIPNLDASITKTKDALPAQLKQQIFRPDVWFSAPPRCNVIFPDDTLSFSYARQFMQEPTRLLLKTNDEFFGEDELFNHFYFAPKVSGLKSKEADLWKTLLNNDIFNHELYTGILPVFEKMGEFNIFAARSGQVDGKQPKVGLAQRTTNFLYFKYRFAARQMQVTTRFKPTIACGFPGLIIDKHVDLETIRRHNELLEKLGRPPRDIAKMMGVHFLGNFTDVAHNCDQGAGTTNITCSYARIPNEKVEFLGNVQDKIEVLKKQNGVVAKHTSTVAALNPPRLGQIGPALGNILSVKEVTSKYTPYGGVYNYSETFPVYGGPRDKKTKDLKLKALVGLLAPAKDFGAEVAEFIGDREITVMFKAYEIVEELPKVRKELVDLEPEEYIRPGWYGDCWHPAKISAVYKDFFGTGAITEATQIQSSGEGGKFTSSDPETTLADAVDNGNLPNVSDLMIQLSQAKGASIQQAVAYIVLTYSIVKQAKFDVNQFITAYGDRPIATMLDMFGSSDLQWDETGREVASGIEGFHSRAFGQQEDLFGLVTSDIESIVGIKRGSEQAQKMDTRKTKQDAVLEYVSALRLGRGLLG